MTSQTPVVSTTTRLINHERYRGTLTDLKVHQCSAVLEMDHLRSRLLSRNYRTSYLKIILTKIMEHELV